MSNKEFDIDEYTDQYDRDHPVSEEALEKYGTDHRQLDTNGIPENITLYDSTFCTNCGITFEYPQRPNAKRRFCSTECSAMHHNKLKSKTDPDQAAINEYLKNNPKVKW